MPRPRPLHVLALTVTLIAGCNSDPLNRQAVGGQVSYKGQPLKAGSVMFVPASGGQTQTGATIENGRFSIAKAQGLSPGKYKVKFTAPDRVSLGPTVPGASGPSDPPPKELLGKKHNEQTQHEVEVKAGGPNEFTFDLD
jgi:hypothetical protein